MLTIFLTVNHGPIVVTMHESPDKSSHDQRAMNTLAAFVRDVEHDVLSVLTALQGHIDLLHDELVLNHVSADRIAVLNRAVARVIADTKVLSTISDLAHTPRSKQILLLETLMQEIAAETRSAFSHRQVSLSCEIADGTTLIGDASALKAIITETVLSLLRQCQISESMRIVGQSNNELVAISFNIGLNANKTLLSPWRLGELRTLPTNGEGVKLASIDAMARLLHGQLNSSKSGDDRSGYEITFKF